MRFNIWLKTLFLNNFVWAIADTKPEFKVPFVINEPIGPKSNGPLHLDEFENMDFMEKEVKLNLEWQYESSMVHNDIRSANKTHIVNYASLRLIFETYNHDGWILFGYVLPELKAPD